MGLELALLCGALQKAFLLSCLGTLERAQAASGSTGSYGCLHLRRVVTARASLLCGEALVYTCCSFSVLGFLYPQGPLLVPRVPRSCFVRHFPGRGRQACVNRFPPLGERITSMPRREEMNSSMLGSST